MDTQTNDDQTKVDALAGTFYSAVQSGFGQGLDRNVVIAVGQAVLNRENALVHLAMVNRSAKSPSPPPPMPDLSGARADPAGGAKGGTLDTDDDVLNPKS